MAVPYFNSFGAATVTAPVVGGYTPYAAPTYGAAYPGFSTPYFGGATVLNSGFAGIPAPAAVAPAATVTAAAFPYSAYNGLSYGGYGALAGYGYGAALPAAAAVPAAYSSPFGYANAFETFSPYSFAPAVATGAAYPALPAPIEYSAPLVAPTVAAPVAAVAPTVSGPGLVAGNRRVWQDGAERGFGARPQRF